MSPLALGAILGAVIVVALVIYTIFAVSRRSQAARLDRPAAPGDAVPDAGPVTGQPAAALPIVEIEALVRERLAAHPDLAGVDIEFGTAQDGGLAVWVDGVGYYDLADIPDARVRALIEEAVAAYNASA